MLQYSINIALALITLSRSELVSDSTRRVVAALLVILIWGKMFDWLRMFDSTSFYVLLLMRTIRDIIPFFSIFLVLMLTFGSSLYILNSNRGENEQQVVE